MVFGIRRKAAACWYLGMVSRVSRDTRVPRGYLGTQGYLGGYLGTQDRFSGPGLANETRMPSTVCRPPLCGRRTSYLGGISGHKTVSLAPASPMKRGCHRPSVGRPSAGGGHRISGHTYLGVSRDTRPFRGISGHKTVSRAPGLVNETRMPSTVCRPPLWAGISAGISGYLGTQDRFAVSRDARPLPRPPPSSMKRVGYLGTQDRFSGISGHTGISRHKTVSLAPASSMKRVCPRPSVGRPSAGGGHPATHDQTLQMKTSEDS